jgi:murein tripeptide amidase MpaA
MLLDNDTQGRSHYYKKDLPQPFENTLRGGWEFQPLGINRRGHFLLTEAITTTASQNILTEAGTLNRGGHPNVTTSVNH